MSDGPILVISDTHFGFEDETAQRFRRFMTYLTGSVQSGRIIIKTSHKMPGGTPGKELSEESLEVPQKIILLGDLVDLWISRDSNTVRPYQESFNPINSLIALKREIVYLVGNHDGIMEKYAGPHELPNGIPFTVCLKGYPNEQNASSPCKGEQIGDRSYFFIHGHQFDPIFRHSSMLHLGNFLGFSSAAAGGFLWFTVLGALVLLLTGVVVLSPLFTNWLPSLLTWLASYAKNSAFAVLMLFGGWIVGAIAFLGVLWLFNVLARAYYNYSLYPGHKRTRKNNQYKSKKPQKSIQQRIGTRHFDPVARHIDADVIITGHTHLPDIYTPEHLPNKLVVNSGSWIVQGHTPHDTFVYIDKRGVRLLQWQDKGGYVSQLKSSLL